jgi:pimeloyl-ACP methyl ester carboxylesterase
MSEQATAILIHGLSETRGVWWRQKSFLEQSMRVISYDIRGFGESPTGAANGTVEQMADDVGQMLSAFETGPAWLVGFSMGGVISQRFALDFPELAKGLILIASSSTVGRGGQEFFRHRIEQVTKGGLEGLAETNDKDARGCFYTKDEDLINEYLKTRVGAVRDPAGYLNACHAMLHLSENPLTGEIRAIRCPTLVIVGEHDPYCPPKASKMISDAILGAELIVVDGVGHCMQFEASDKLNKLTADFIDRHEKA